MMAVKLLFFFFAFTPLACLAQKIEVKKDIYRIEGEQESGFQVSLDAPREVVQASLSRFFKTLGKTRSSDDFLTAVDPLIDGKKMEVILYGACNGDGKKSTVWIGMRGKGDASGVSDDIRKLTYDFAVTFQREQIQVQIDESLRALQAVEKKQTRLVNQHKDLNNKIDNNKKEKLELEKSLVENKIELEDLTKKLEGNVRAQDSVAVASGQIKKVVEMHREKQRKVQ